MKLEFIIGRKTKKNRKKTKDKVPPQSGPLDERTWVFKKSGCCWWKRTKVKATLTSQLSSGRGGRGCSNIQSTTGGGICDGDLVQKQTEGTSSQGSTGDITTVTRLTRPIHIHCHQEEMRSSLYKKKRDCKFILIVRFDYIINFLGNYIK